MQELNLVWTVQFSSSWIRGTKTTLSFARAGLTDWRIYPEMIFLIARIELKRRKIKNRIVGAVAWQVDADIHAQLFRYVLREKVRRRACARGVERYVTSQLIFLAKASYQRFGFYEYTHKSNFLRYTIVYIYIVYIYDIVYIYIYGS